MNTRGRKASIPPADHARPPVLSPDGLVVHHSNRNNQVADYDFSVLAVAEPLQRSLSALFAARCVPHRWTSHNTSRNSWEDLVIFATFLSQQEQPPGDLSELTAAMLKRWRTSQSGSASGYNRVTRIARLLRGDPRLQAGRIADELATRVRRPKSTSQSYSEAEFEKIKLAARRTFRTALLRIADNTRHLQRWRRGECVEGSQDWVLGEGLDFLARTGRFPHTVGPSGQPTMARKYRKVLGASSAKAGQRLFLSCHEAVALGVLLMAEYGWNLSVIDRAEVPRAAPDPGEDGHPTYRIPLEKYRRGGGHYFETRNVTDDGAASAGRLITEALEATRFARTLVEELAPGTDRLIIWHAALGGDQLKDLDRLPPVGRFHFGITTQRATHWAKSVGLTGSPFRRGRRTVNALDRRQPGQNSQETHERHYALVDKRVQAGAVEVIATGAEDAADRARASVLVAELRNEPQGGDVETATADCHDYDNGPYPAPGGGCGASFLMCLGCENARVHPGHHSRLTHLHHALSNLRSILAPQAWSRDWGEAHERLEDLKTKLGEGIWRLALARVTDADRALIADLLTGELDT
ncbi:hypothetical protein [Streptosporangium sp. NPDC006930]|uniref:hypothetical protein n=1 Tax=Streptosporangium sp. NPDC006930 TaxID=3154783 RepID=UPI00342E8680